MKRRDREEWLSVPVDITGAGLTVAMVDRGREVAKSRYTKPSQAAARFWQLRGIVFCGECGSILSPHQVTATRADGRKVRTPYYQCRRKWSSGTKDCDHTKSYPTAALEEAIWKEVFALISDPERLFRGHAKAIERRKREMRGDPDREVRHLAERLEKLERRRSGYIDLAADGDLPARSYAASWRRWTRSVTNFAMPCERCRVGSRASRSLRAGSRSGR